MDVPQVRGQRDLMAGDSMRVAPALFESANGEGVPKPMKPGARPTRVSDNAGTLEQLAEDVADNGVAERAGGARNKDVVNTT
jgi:hypothetical protein